MGVPGRDALRDAGRPVAAPLPPEAPAAAPRRPATALAQVPPPRLLRLRGLLPDGPGRRRRLPRLALQPRGRREDALLLRAPLALRAEGPRRPRPSLRRRSLLLVPLPLPLRGAPRGAVASLSAQGHAARALLHRLRPLHEGLPVAPARGPARPRALGRVLLLPVLRRRLPGAPRPARRDPGAVAPRGAPGRLRRAGRGPLRGGHAPRAGDRTLDERDHGGGVRTPGPDDRLPGLRPRPGPSPHPRGVGGRRDPRRRRPRVRPGSRGDRIGPWRPPPRRSPETRRREPWHASSSWARSRRTTS